MRKPTLLALAISWRLQARPSLESIDADAALDKLSAKPSFNRACGIKTCSMRDLRRASGVLAFFSSILRPAAVLPKEPVTATMSFGCAPLRRTRFVFSISPNNDILIMRSVDSPVSPPIT